MKIKLKLLSVLFTFFLILSVFPVGAYDQYAPSYAPYINEAQVPEFENIEINGLGSVDLFTGAATYSYPIKVPEGVNGLKPVLSLNYNHQTTNSLPSLIGYGWDLNNYKIMRNIEYTRGSSNDDTFELYFNGAKHKLVSIGGGEYRTEVETFLKIVKYSNYWKIYRKDGTFYEFGNTASSRMSCSQENFDSVWSLNKVQDVYGNTIEYSYSEDNGVTELTTIEYGDARISFSYDSSIFEQRSFYVQGHEVNFDDVISSIRVYYDNSLVRTYDLDYYTYPVAFGDRSILDKITEKGSSGGTLNNIEFEYYQQTPGWTRNSDYDLPEEIEEDYDKGYRFVDVNRDGLVDFMQGYQNEPGDDWDDFHDDAWLNTGGGWSRSYTWEPPYAFTIEGDEQEGMDRGVRFSDVDGDGYIDYLVGNDVDDSDNDEDLPEYLLGVYRNTGSSFSSNHNLNHDVPNFADWDDNDYWDEYSYDNNYRLADVNGDGLDDLLRGDSYTKLNNGNQWTSTSYWVAPDDFAGSDRIDSGCETQRGVNQGLYFADVNGDGLNDLIWNYDHKVDDDDWDEVYINNGEEFVFDNSWNPPSDFVEDEYDSGTCNGILANDQGLRLADVNGDGLVDVIKARDGSRIGYINNGNEWRATHDWDPIDDFVEDNGNDPGYRSSDTRLVDLNGDGMVDMISNGDRAYINRGAKNYLLKEITNEHGAEINFNYKSSTEYQQSGSQLGFNVWVVSSITYDNDMNGAHENQFTYTYDYENGMYDYDDNEFRGFQLVTETRPDGSYLVHEFHQDEYRAGMEKKVQLYDNYNHKYQENYKQYSTINGNGNKIVELDYEKLSTYDQQSQAYYFYNYYDDYDSYGNVLTKREKGIVGGNTEERYTHYEYVYNTNKWIVNKPKLEEVRDHGNSQVLKKTKFYYDYLGYGSIGNYGALTQTKELISGSSNYKDHSYVYNAHGNLAEETDDNGFTTTYVYDSDNLYIKDVTNALNQVYHYDYDQGTGNLLSEEDPNGYETEYKYDQYGRITKEIREYDSVTYPTVSYTYQFNGDAPEYVIKKEKEFSSDTFDTIYYYDGFGKVIQIKTDYQTDSDDVVTNIFYNDMNQISSISYPYSRLASSSYATPDTSVEEVSYQYDPLGRETVVTNPDGSTVVNDYTRYYTKVTDENGNYKKYYHDGFSNIIEIEERNDGSTYDTFYYYNDVNLLTEIEDDNGNNFLFYYDKLGRMTDIDDPDLGEWSYVYDGEDNLVQQDDDNGNRITMIYDELNRIVSKNDGEGSIIFEYDIDTIGTLGRVTKSGYQVEYEYDNRLRVDVEEVRIEGRTFTKDYEYDHMDRITDIDLNSGVKEIEYIYNDGDQVRTLKENNNQIITEILYEDFGSKDMVIYANGLTTHYNYYYDTLRLDETYTLNTQYLDYTYDDVGNVMTISDNVNNVDLSMTYDDLDRLTDVSRTSNDGADDYNITYDYDAIGNILDIWYDHDNTNDHYDFTYNGNPVHSPSSVVAPSIAPECNPDDDLMIWGLGCTVDNACPYLQTLEFTVRETDVISLNIIDTDGDELDINYPGQFDQDGEWHTTEDDAGTYNLPITINDGYCTIHETIHIVIEENNCPVIHDLTFGGKEGDLFTLEISDADGDQLDITYPEQFDQNGEWQTTVGDAGDYFLPINVSDGYCLIEETLRLTIAPNQCPEISLLNGAVSEGDLVTISVIDPDNDDLEVTYPQEFGQNGEWQTSVGDGGTYNFEVTATDGLCTVNENIPLFINSCPTIDNTYFFGKEGDVFNVNFADPDGDSLEITYPEQFEPDGEWATVMGEADTYYLPISATDGLCTLNEILNVNLAPNYCPVIEPLNVMVNDGELVDIDVSDPDDIDFEVYFPDPFDSNGRWTPTVNDLGINEFIVTATDGVCDVEETVTVDVNSCPTIVNDYFSVKEGDFIELEFDDLDGDQLNINYNPPFDENGEWQIEVGDAGVYRPTISFDDGFCYEVEGIDIYVTENQCPVIHPLNIVANAGDLVTILATDPDGEDLEITYPAPFNDDGEWQTTLNDAGEHDFEVTATEGLCIAEETVHVQLIGHFGMDEDYQPDENLTIDYIDYDVEPIDLFEDPPYDPENIDANVELSIENVALALDSLQYYGDANFEIVMRNNANRTINTDLIVTDRWSNLLFEVNDIDLNANSEQIRYLQRPHDCSHDLVFKLRPNMIIIDPDPYDNRFIFTEEACWDITPELRIINVNLITPLSELEQTSLFEIIIRNNGREADDVEVSIYVDAETYSQGGSDRINRVEEYSDFIMYYTFHDDPCNKFFSFEVDPDEEILERFENNNDYEIEFECPDREGSSGNNFLGNNFDSKLPSSDKVPFGDKIPRDQNYDDSLNKPYQNKKTVKVIR